MASSINPYNINGNYPVAGQDNDSQGFRDNFTNLRNNLVFAKTEIEDLQRNAVLKNALAGTSLDNNLAGAEIGAPKLRSWTETRVTEAGAVGTVDVNFNYGNFYHITPVGDVTLRLINFPNAGYGCVRVWFTITNVSHNVTLPPGLLGAENITGYDSATSTITFPAAGSYLLEISTFDRTTYLARDLTKTVADGIALSNLSVVTNSPGTAALTYNSGTGVFTFTPPDLGTAPLTLTGLSVTNASAGNISLSYNPSTGVFTFTPPAAPDLRDIDDVVITTPADKQILYYNSSDSTWKNSSLSTVLDSLGTAAYPLVEYTVTVADDGSGSQDVFHLNGTPLKDDNGNLFEFVLNTNTRYRFDVSDSSNGAFKFSTTPDTLVPGSVTDYTDGVTVVGTAGTAGAYVEIAITDDTPSPLYFWTPDLVSPSRDGTLIGAALPIHINGRTQTSQLINNGDDIDLGLKTGYFSTIAASTSTLAAGVEGDTKVFAMKADGGDMVITVTNAGWKTTGTGTITFSAIGQACQLQYISEKWFCVGNNGAAFA